MPLPLEGARILDFTWLNAGAKGTRHLALYGADVVHIEWKGKLDVLRTSGPHHKMPGDDSPGTDPGYSQLSVASVNRGASFNNNHVGKWGISLNMRDPKGKEVFRELLRVSDAVVDNFTAATLADWGFPFDEMVKVKPDIVYVQAPGFGFQGPYRDYRSYGPTAAAVSGLTFMSGLPDRYPVGYGFSYMDVCGPYFVAMATMMALRQRDRTKKGVWVDSSQAGPAFLLTGTSIMDWSANGRSYERSGNRSAYEPAAPHGAYRCRGDDMWIAIACRDDAEWDGLVAEMGGPEWTASPQFATLTDRYENQDELDAHIEAWTLEQERYDLMERLQARGVPAGVCQNTRDRYEIDPQLAHNGYFVNMPHSEVPSYDVEGHAGRFSETPPSPFGQTGHGAKCYAEDTESFYADVLGMSQERIARLQAEDVI